MNIPNDDNGDVLRRMLSHGDDLSKPRDIDFNHVFQSERDASIFCEASKRIGFDRMSYRYWEEGSAWDVLVKIFMIPSHSEITEIELTLDTLAKKFGGRADGWGCLQPECNED